MYDYENAYTSHRINDMVTWAIYFNYNEIRKYLRNVYVAFNNGKKMIRINVSFKYQQKCSPYNDWFPKETHLFYWKRFSSFGIFYWDIQMNAIQILQK